MLRDYRRALALALLALMSACRHDETDAPSAPRPPIRGLVIDSITTATFRPSLTYVATVLAAQDVSLGVVAGGRVEKVSVELGDRVKKGTELVRLRDADARAAAGSASAALAQARARAGAGLAIEDAPDVRAAQIALDTATDARKRLEPLLAQGSVSEQDMVRAKAQERTAAMQLEAAKGAARASAAAVDQAIAGASQANVVLSELTLRAPFDGVVVERAVRLGETVAAGAPLVRIVDDSSYRLELDVPLQESGQIVLGARVWIDGARALDGRPLSGTVTRASAALQSDSRLRRVQASLASPSGGTMLLSGARVRVRVEVGAETPRPRVPCDAIRVSAGVSRIWVLNGTKAEEHLVAELRREPREGAGAKSPEQCILDADLEGGERVVRNPPPELRDGDEVLP